jgi:thymidine phosphorylase
MPRKKWDEMIAAQGADLQAFNKKLLLDSTASIVAEVKSEKSGFVFKCDARVIGEVIRDLGGGRLTKESPINYDVGMDQIAKPGERVEKGGVLCRIHAAGRAQVDSARARIKSAFELAAKPKKPAPLISEIIG